MQDQFSPYIPLIYLLAAIPYAWMGLDAWRKRPAVAVTPFAWIMLGMSFWSFTYGLEIFFPILSFKLWITNLEYVGIVIAPVLLLFFAFEYTGKSHLLTIKIRLMVWTIPLLALFLVWTNPLHHLMWSGETVKLMGGLSLLDVQKGVFFWIHAMYSYALAVLASLILIMEFLQRPGAFRLRISLVILAIFLPLAGNLMFVLETSPFGDLDVTPLFFLPAALGLSWATTRYRLLEILPLEHLTVLKNMRDGVMVMNSQQRILYINPTAEILFNRTEDKAIGQPLERVAGPYAEKLIPHLSDSGQHIEITIEEGENSMVYEVVTSSFESLKENLTGAPDTMITLHDVTHRKMTEIDLNRRNAVMSAISLAAEVFLKEAAWEHNIPAVLEKIGYAVDVSRIFVVMNYIDDETKELYSSLCYEWAAPDIKSQIENPKLQHVPLHQAGFARWEKGLSHGEHLLGDVADFPESERNFFAELGSVSIAVIPIFVENQWWGFLMFEDCKQERYWTDMEVKAFHTMANIFGSAESRARTEQKLLWRQKTLSLLQTIVHDALQANNLNSMAQSIVDRLADLIGADGCFLTSWDEANQKTNPLAAYGLFHDKYVMLKSNGKITFTESALKAGHTLVVNDVHTSPYVDPEISAIFPSRSVIVLPLIAGGRKLGAIIISFDNPHRFQMEEITIAEQAASLIALAFEKFQTMEQAQTRAATSEKLRMAGTFITEARAMDDVVRRILDQLKEVVTYDSASVQVLDGDELEIFGGSGWDDLNQVIGMRFPIPGNNPNTAVIRSGKACLFDDVGAIYKDFRKPPHDHIHSWLGVPLIAQNKVIGLLAIDSIEPGHFKPGDVELVTVFADQVAVVLEEKIHLRETETQAITDSLTGVYNRRGLLQIGEQELSRASRTDRSFSMLMIDVDHFKRVNDRYGHITGDQALRQVAERCRMTSRSVDIVGRYGGEEFVILLIETPLDAACVVAERLRQSIADIPFQIDAGPLHMTISIGGAQARDKESLLDVIARADTAMYKAKAAGRNCVVVDESPQAHSHT
jgi:diguanylate cyclase (GGDEF)-like protein